MCLTSNTMKRCLGQYGFSIDDQEFIINAYNTIWKNLDHSRLYCINPGAVAGEILKHYGRVVENTWIPINLSNDKIKQYEKIFVILIEALDKQ